MLSGLPVMAFFTLASGASCRCNAGERVWAFLQNDWWLATVLRRNPGMDAEVQVEDLGHAMVPATKLRTLYGQLCACAALCFFGRVGNLHDKFHEAGSTEEALAISAASVWEYVIRGNSDMYWDIFAHTWDQDLAEAINEAYRPLQVQAELRDPTAPAVESFGESVWRSSELRRREEIKRGFRYDLVVLMRYDILFRRPLNLWLSSNETLWTSHWCSIHSEDLLVREVVLSWEPHAGDPRFQKTGVLAPSQFAPVGLHDFWFAGPSVAMEHFAAWGSSRDRFLQRYELQSDELPLDVGHFYTYLHAKELGLKLMYTGISYLDFTLVRYRDCKLRIAEEILPPDIFCSHWEVSITRQCDAWILKESGWAHHFCPIAGRRVLLAPGAHSCGRF